MNFTEFKERYQKVLPQHYPTDISENPLVSVIIQTYNHEKYIRECLDSILSQKVKFPYEILLGEDASSDDTRRICIDYAKKYPEKIRLFLHHPENKIKVKGIKTGNFNAFYNFFQAKGKYIAFCEGDDYWGDNHKLNYQVKALQSDPTLSCTFHSFIEKFDMDKMHANKLDQPDQDVTAEELGNLKFHPHLSTVCFRNSFNGFPEEMIRVINVDSFLLSLLGNQGPAKFLPNIKPNIYRRHDSGIWTQNLKEKKFLIKANTFKGIANFYKRSGNKDRLCNFNRLTRNVYRSLFLIYLKSFKIIKAAGLIKRVI